MRQKKVGLGQPGSCFARGIETVCLQDSVTKHVDWCGWSMSKVDERASLHGRSKGIINIDGLEEV